MQQKFFSLTKEAFCDRLGRIISLSWHPSGTLIAAGMMDMIRVFDAKTGKEIQISHKVN